MITKDQAEFVLRHRINDQVAALVGEEFDEQDREVIEIVLLKVFRTQQMETIHGALREMACIVSAAEWRNIVTPEIDAWVFGVEVTT